MGELKRNKKNERVGQIYKNIEGYNAICIDYKERNDIYVQFLDEHKQIIHTTWAYFTKGKFHNPYAITLYNKGSIGNVSAKGENHKAYATWRDMINRCYRRKHPRYKDCSICDEWLCFENFLQWYKKNYYEIPNERTELDKDILYKGNKIYSPQTCIFVPSSINKLIIKSNKTRGKFPIGVSRYNSRNDCFISKCSVNGKPIKLGIFDTPEKAFLCYKNFKENYIKEYILNYKDIIPNKIYEKIYDTLYNYKVEITD